MSEQRRERRFNLNLQTTIQVQADDGDSFCAVATTRDISCAGAYLFLDSPFPVGTRTDLQICLRPVLEPAAEPEQLSAIRVMGTVLRSEPGGMTVRFDREFDYLEPN